MTATRERATTLLAELAGSSASFRPNQLEAIEALVDERRRVLLVQRTGWGKSAVYFIATKLLREAGSGPTILVSPLLALMRNQIQMAERMGVRAVTINSGNTDEWEQIRDRLAGDDVDLLLVSPERFNNASFRNDVVPSLAARSGLLVVDEVHCISDWGHDFRPDYRRIARILTMLPAGTPVLGATATANDRVVADVGSQLGTDLLVLRGTLAREGLALQVLDLPAPAQRLAWLVEALRRIDGSGIVYCLTIGDAQRVAQWLRDNGIDAVDYSGDSSTEKRIEIEDALIANTIKVVVATSALGMGFDKPDLAFVIHFQSPGSPIAYYQQVGRAGRALDRSIAVLLSGYEDREIQDYFIRTAFPAEPIANRIVELIEAAPIALSVPALQAEVNIAKGRLEQMLKILEIEGAVEKVKGGYRRTKDEWVYPAERVAGITAARHAEQAAMRAYVTKPGCLMERLRIELDDPAAGPCGICERCAGPALSIEIPAELAAAATSFLRARPLEIEPRLMWPAGVPGRKGKIAESDRLMPGRALSQAGDGGWSALVESGRADGAYPDELVAAAARLIREWSPSPPPAWITVIPSLSHPGLIESFAERLADSLELPFVEAVRVSPGGRPQSEMQNAPQQLRNVASRIAVPGPVRDDPVLLIDDEVASRWTMTAAGVALRIAGSGTVWPFALTRRSS